MDFKYLCYLSLEKLLYRAPPKVDVVYRIHLDVGRPSINKVSGTFWRKTISSVHLIPAVAPFTNSFFTKFSTHVLAWISKYMPGKEWDVITYPFPNFNGYRWSLGMDK